jgi:hypothetical protein
MQYDDRPQAHSDKLANCYAGARVSERFSHIARKLQLLDAAFAISKLPRPYSSSSFDVARDGSHWRQGRERRGRQSCQVGPFREHHKR